MLLVAPGDAAPPPPAAPTEAMAAASISRSKSPMRAKSPMRQLSPMNVAAAAEPSPVPSDLGSPISPQGLPPRVGPDALVPPSAHSDKSMAKFEEVNSLDADAQCKFFLKSFIFALKDDWKAVPQLLKEYKKQAKDTGDGTGPPDSLNHIQVHSS